MMDNKHNIQKWLCQQSNCSQKSKIQKIFTKLLDTKKLWLKNFQQSIQLWVDFIYLKIQSTIKDLNAIANQQTCQSSTRSTYSQDILHLMKQTEQLVLKGLKNIQKLYMIPQLKQKSINKQKQNIFKTKSKSKFQQRGRSNSYTNSRHGKSELFNTGIFKFAKVPTADSFFKPQHFSTLNSNQPLSRFSKTSNSQIPKHQKCKPKYPSSNTTFSQNNYNNYNNFNTTQQTKPNLVSIPTEQSMDRSIHNYFQNKEKLKQQQITEQIASKFQQKIKCLEYDINIKFNKIIENLIQNKNNANTQKTQNHNESTIKQIIKIQQIPQITQNPKNKLPPSEPQKPKTKQLHHQNNQIKSKQQPQQQKAQQKIIKIENNLQLFYSLTAKIKLQQLNQSLMRLFIHSYLYFCSDNQLPPHLQKINQHLSSFPSLISKQKIKQQFKQNLIKFKKMLNLDKIKDRVEKAKMYINRAMRCAYDLIICQEIAMDGQTIAEIDKMVLKL